MAVVGLVSGEFDASLAGNKQPENLIPGPCKSPRFEPENLDEIKTSLGKQIMSDLAKISAEGQKEMIQHIAPLN